MGLRINPVFSAHGSRLSDFIQWVKKSA